MEILWAKDPGRKQPASPELRAGVRAETFTSGVLPGRVEVGREGHSYGHTPAPSASQPPGAAERALWLMQHQRGEGQAWIGRVRGAPWWNQTECDPDLMFCVGNGVERLVWHHVTDYRWRGTRGKMSDAVEIAQPVGGGALTVAGKWRGRKRLQWGGVSSCQSRRAQHGAENGFGKNLGLIFWT